MHEPPKLDYATPRPKLRADWGKIGWAIVAVLFTLMCCGFLMWCLLLAGAGGRH